MGRERTCDVARRIQWNDADPSNYLLLCIEKQMPPSPENDDLAPTKTAQYGKSIT